jgi:hypothetical protein
LSLEVQNTIVQQVNMPAAAAHADDVHPPIASCHVQLVKVSPHSPMKAAFDDASAASGVLPLLVFVESGLMERAAV